MAYYTKNLLESFQNSYHSRLYHAQKCLFTQVADKDVYNITAPFLSGDHLVIAGRVEDRESEFSTLLFFEQVENRWQPIPHAPSYHLQDPFFTHIHGELILGGVEVTPINGDPHKLSWRTKFLKGKDIFTLEPWCYGPDQMKDLRLAELSNGEIIIFTRPQGEKGGRGQIGVAKIADLSHFTHDVIANAPLLNLFDDQEWGGVNEIHLLNEQYVGLLAHIATFDELGNRHYYPMSFLLDVTSMQPSEVQIIFERTLLPADASKREDLIDVIFAGGLIRHSNGMATLYAGVSDAVAYQITLPDPFSIDL